MGLKDRMYAGEVLVGTFLKTPAYELVEVLSRSGLDFICLDGEHGSFDRARLDACLAIGRALDFPILVRVGAGTPKDILQALDAGAVGLVVPHVDSAEKAREIARSARFGVGGRGFAGGTRWAGYGDQSMAEVLAQSQAETIVIAQIEEPEGVEAAADIAATEGIDGLFIGPADLSVAYGKTDQKSPELMAAIREVGAATRAAGKAYVTFVTDPDHAARVSADGVSMFFVASELTWMRKEAAAVTKAIKSA